MLWTQHKSCISINMKTGTIGAYSLHCICHTGNTVPAFFFCSCLSDLFGHNIWVKPLINRQKGKCWCRMLTSWCWITKWPHMCTIKQRPLICYKYCSMSAPKLWISDTSWGQYNGKFISTPLTYTDMKQMISFKYCCWAEQLWEQPPKSTSLSKHNIRQWKHWVWWLQCLLIDRVRLNLRPLKIKSPEPCLWLTPLYACPAYKSNSAAKTGMVGYDTPLTGKNLQANNCAWQISRFEGKENAITRCQADLSSPK